MPTALGRWSVPEDHKVQGNLQQNSYTAQLLESHFVSDTGISYTSKGKGSGAEEPSFWGRGGGEAESQPQNEDIKANRSCVHLRKLRHESLVCEGKDQA